MAYSEDLELFLEEFGTLLNKYHFAISPFQVSLFDKPSSKIVGFSQQENKFFYAHAEIDRGETALNLDENESEE